METKNPKDFVLKKLEQLGYESHHLFPPRGHGAGGLALFWNSKINIDVMYSNANLIDTHIEYIGKSFLPLLSMETVIGNKDKCNGLTCST